MKITAFILLCALLLGGCASKGGNDEREDFLEIRAKYIGEESLSLAADLRADYGDRVYDYKLSYNGSGESGILNVTEPAVIKDLSAVYKDGTVSLSCDGALIDTGAIFGGSVSPLQAFPMLIEAWKNGYISKCWYETRGEIKCTAAEIVISEGQENVVCRAWFDSTELKPVYSEIAVNDFTVIYCEFT